MDKMYLQELKILAEKRLPKRALKSSLSSLVPPSIALGPLAAVGLTAWLTNASSSCKRVSGSPEEYEACMGRMKIKALEHKRVSLSSRVSGCLDTNNPQKCQEKMAKKIEKISAVIDDLRSKYGA